MLSDQWTVFLILGTTLALFIWNRLRFDIVAMLALLAVAVTGLVVPDQLFTGFGHPAVITVAAVLVISQGLVNGGVVDAVARLLGKVGRNAVLQVITLTLVVALCSGFINNVGALALLMPVAIWMSRQSGRSPSLLLMPLAFGSLLGGTITLIGTPPNIIIASYREAGSFGLFDFAPVGLAITVVGIVFIGVIGWRLTPKRDDPASGDKLFSVGEYVTELKVPEESPFAGGTLHNLLTSGGTEKSLVVLALIRGEEVSPAPSTFNVLKFGDVLLVEADTESLQEFVEQTGLVLANAVNDEDEEGKESQPMTPREGTEEQVAAGDVRLTEAVISPSSRLIGRSANRLNLRERYGLNVVAIARQGHRLKRRLAEIRFRSGDILLVQGYEDNLLSTLQTLGCLPLAERGLTLGREKNLWLAGGVFLAAIAIILSGLLTPPVALVACAVAMVLVQLMDAGEAYRAIDWPVIVLLAAMIPVGQALETTGGAALIAEQILTVAQGQAAWVALTIILVGTMLLSNVVNNAAAAILVAPIALGVSSQLGLASDAVLMAVAVGASCAFLTPIGHQSNALVMEPAGYRFGDYWRLGLPLSVLVTVVGVPMILWVWG
ncbi:MULTISPECIES: SLC13 family permease [unclassified Marinobacter]|uniref:SLC13 family permease n=1 Tax=Marinobacter nauticus TaxID=2743 RepID=A0A455W808_MARNT|nr:MULTISPECIES: SLC13 family permease [unclassified Marinobacter]QFS88544.1 Citrate transporter [Marinobacter sp. THAF197a]QFT52329.1 Citrate transporter [Marinobacter sp. THAF39]BBJ05639.1 SLC13 family permease [Marinobacter nauticus]